MKPDEGKEVKKIVKYWNEAEVLRAYYKLFNGNDENTDVREKRQSMNWSRIICHPKAHS